MSTNKTFCEECRKDVEYLTEVAALKGKLKGVEYKYTGKRAICAECGSEVYVAEIEDENLKALYDAYRQRLLNKYCDDVHEGSEEDMIFRLMREKENEKFNSFD